MRIDLLLTDRKSYTFEAYAAERVSQTLNEKNISYKVIYLSDGSLQDYLYYIKESPPKWSLSFANLTPQEIPLCDLVRVPHFCWLEESIAFAIPYLHSKYGNLGVPNQNLCDQLSRPNVLFLPHGVEVPSLPAEKTFEAVFFGDLIDLSFLERGWKDLLSEDEIQLIKRAIEHKNPLLAEHLYYYAESYLNAQISYALITSFQDIRLDVFGEHVGNNWLVRLPNKEQVFLHSRLPYCEHFEVLQASHTALIPLNSPWYLPAIAANCLPLRSYEEVSYYLAHLNERELKLTDLKKGLSNKCWENQTERLLEVMS